MICEFFHKTLLFIKEKNHAKNLSKNYPWDLTYLVELFNFPLSVLQLKKFYQVKVFKKYKTEFYLVVYPEKLNKIEW